MKIQKRLTLLVFYVKLFQLKKLNTLRVGCLNPAGSGPVDLGEIITGIELPKISVQDNLVGPQVLLTYLSILVKWGSVDKAKPSVKVGQKATGRWQNCLSEIIDKV